MHCYWAVKLPWIFPGAPLIPMGLPEIPRVTWQLCCYIPRYTRAATKAQGFHLCFSGWNEAVTGNWLGTGFLLVARHAWMGSFLYVESSCFLRKSFTLVTIWIFARGWCHFLNSFDSSRPCYKISIKKKHFNRYQSIYSLIHSASDCLNFSYEDLWYIKSSFSGTVLISASFWQVASFC